MTRTFALFALLLSTASALHFTPYKKWDNETNVYLLNLDRAAYCDPVDIQSWTCAACQGKLEIYSMFNSSSYENFGFAAYDPSLNRIIITFRGSSNIPNWIEDLDFVMGDLAPYLPNIAGVGVHTGFRDSYVSMQAEVHTSIKNLLQQYPSAEVFVTGHSLGGAQAMLCSFDLAYSLGIPNTVYTYGEPRVGNKPFADLVNKYVNVWRFVNMRDIVPHLPFVDGMGFYHETTEIWIDLDKNLVTCSSTDGEDPKCSDSLYNHYSAYDHTHYFGPYTGCYKWPAPK